MNRRALQLFALCAASYFVAARLGYAAMTERYVVVWFPAGLMLAALSMNATRDWPAIITGGMLGGILADMLQALPADVVISSTIANTLETTLAALVVRRFTGPNPTMHSLRDFAAVFVGAAMLSNAVTSFLGSLVIQHGWNIGFANAWFVWWVGDGMGMIVVAPVILATAEMLRTMKSVSARLVIEALAILAAVAVASRLLLVNVVAPESVEESQRYLIIPLMIWAGVRLWPWGATTSTLVLTLVSLWTLHTSPVAFSAASATATGQVFEVASYLALAGVSALIPAVILAEQRRLQVEASITGQRLKEMAESIDDVFFIIEEPGGTPLYLSPAWANIWGRPIEQGYDNQVRFDAMHPDDRPAVAAAKGAGAQGRGADVTFRIFRPDGTIRWIKSKSFPVRDETGQARRTVGVARDITDLRDAEQRMLQAQKVEAVGRLAGGVAHDFNNILTVIMAEADFLRANASLPPDAADSLAEIQHSAQSAAALTRQLLAFSRRQIVEPRLFDVNVAVRDMSKMLQRLIGEDIHLEIVLGPEMLGVRADQGQLEQVMANLVVNARDAMPRGGNLTVETLFVEALPGAPASDAGSVVLTVRDTGVGMSSEVIAHAFEPFYTTKPTGVGTGLGLATCHSIVQAAGGRIDIASEVGRGTTVRVSLPFVPISLEKERADAASAAPRGSETILLVEDEAAVRKVTARLLRAQGYQVIEARDAAEALRQLERPDARVNLLLTDVVLPGMGGRELADLARVGRPDMRTLFASGYTDDVILKNQLLNQDSVVLQKPFTAEALARRVREALDTPEAHAGSGSRSS